MAKRAAKPADEELDEIEDSVADTAPDDEDDDQEGSPTETNTEEDGAVDESQDTEGDAPQAPSWRERLGGEYGSLDDDTAVTRLQERLRASEEAQRNAQQWQYLYAQQQQALQLQQQQAAAAAAQPQQSSWKPPEFDPGWLQFVTRDENGNLVAKSGADPTLPQKIETYARWKQENEQKFWSDPYQFVMPGIMPQIEQRVSQIIEQAVQRERHANAVSQWERDKLHLLTSDKQPIRQDGTNLTPFGRQIIQHTMQLAQTGVTDPITALNFAYQTASGDVAWAHLNQQQQQKSATEKSKDQKASFLKKQVPRNRDGSFAKNTKGEPAAPIRKSFRDSLREEYAKVTGNTED